MGSATTNAAGDQANQDKKKSGKSTAKAIVDADDGAQ